MSYTTLTHSQFLELVLNEIEEKYNKEVDVVFTGYTPSLIAEMINDAIDKFQPLGFSPKRVAQEIDNLMTCVNSKTIKH